MDIRHIYLLGFVLLLFSCDPNSREISLSINNKTNQTFKINLFMNSEENSFDISELISIQFLKYSALGGGFNAIADFDSIKIYNTINGKKIKWAKPDNTYGYLDTDNNIGTERDVPKDIYNSKYWTLQANGDDEEWIFTIIESDLELFE